MNWLKLFDERQQKEIKFSQVYVNEFEHGTDGHNAKVIIAKMSALLDKIEVTLKGDNWDEEIAAKAREVLGLK